MSRLIKVGYEDSDLLDEIKSLMDNTHQYNTELFADVELMIDTVKSGIKVDEDNFEELLRQCRTQLSNCHCDDHETFESLVERLSK